MIFCFFLCFSALSYQLIEHHLIHGLLYALIDALPDIFGHAELLAFTALLGLRRADHRSDISFQCAQDISD